MIEKLENTFSNTEKAYLILGPISPNWRDTVLNLNSFIEFKTPEEFMDFNDKWNTYLNKLDLLWNRFNAFVISGIEDNQKRQKMKGFLDNINGQRTSDELLVYLDKARNSSQHTLQEVLEDQIHNDIIMAGNNMNVVKDGNDFKLFASKGGGHLQALIVFEKRLIKLNSVAIKVKTNKIRSESKIYNPPTSCLGRPLSQSQSLNPIVVGGLGLLYYEKVLEELKSRIII
jgi:hypothetical protein